MVFMLVGKRWGKAYLVVRKKSNCMNSAVVRTIRKGRETSKSEDCYLEPIYLCILFLCLFLGCFLIL
jgi:hypothetical protein